MESFPHRSKIELGVEMNQSELIEKMARVSDLTEAEAGQALRAIAEIIVDAASSGEDPVRVPGLGSFAVVKHPARLGRNPRTGESIEIAARSILRFRAGKTVRDALNPQISLRVDGKKRVPKRKLAVRK
jgi:DNA-binding protein HU-beta